MCLYPPFSAPTHCDENTLPSIDGADAPSPSRKCISVAGRLPFVRCSMSLSGLSSSPATIGVLVRSSEVGVSLVQGLGSLRVDQALALEGGGAPAAAVLPSGSSRACIQPSVAARVGREKASNCHH